MYTTQTVTCEATCVFQAEYDALSRLDLSIVWTVEFYIIYESKRPVAAFRPHTVYVRRLSLGLHLWPRMKAPRKRATGKRERHHDQELEPVDNAPEDQKSDSEPEPDEALVASSEADNPAEQPDAPEDWVVDVAEMIDEIVAAESSQQHAPGGLEEPDLSQPDGDQGAAPAEPADIVEIHSSGIFGVQQDDSDEDHAEVGASSSCGPVTQLMLENLQS